MIPREILKKIRQIEIRTNRIVTESLAGAYHSVFKGQGMNFDEVREYQPGDDVRAIDWNVTARMNHPFIKKFVEERELTLMLIVDVSGSFRSGDLIEVRDEGGQVFARGLTNYAAGEIRRVQGLRSEQFEAVLGYRGFEEIIHRDNLVLERRAQS